MHPSTPTTGTDWYVFSSSKTPETSCAARFAERLFALSLFVLIARSCLSLCHTLVSAPSRMAHVLTKMASASSGASVMT